MISPKLEDEDWRLRLAIYRSFVKNERPPTYQEMAQQFDMTEAQARDAFHRLNDAHQVFLDPGSDRIRMAHPLSAVPTPFRVHVQGRTLWANCAWDSLGIPAMLHADAEIEAEYGHTGEPVTYRVENGEIHADDDLVHFALPFSQWYDDLIHT